MNHYNVLMVLMELLQDTRILPNANHVCQVSIVHNQVSLLLMVSVIQVITAKEELKSLILQMELQEIFAKKVASANMDLRE